MKKGYYIFFGSNSLGVSKKMDMQLAEMRKFFDVEFLKVQTGKRTLFKKLVSRIPWLPIGFDYEDLKKKIVNPDFLYIRRYVADCAYVDFFKWIKEKYPKCKIIVEIFTYPYDKDDFNRSFIHRVKQLPFYLKDSHYRWKLKGYVDRFVTYSKDGEIFNIPTIQTTNGVCVESIAPKKTNLTDKNKITLVSVAAIQTHHGYERLIKGLGNYYAAGGKRDILYNVVGDGKDLEYYKNLANSYNLGEHIVFHGRQNGDALDALYDTADIAIASLGLYKYDINIISTLKTCEYMAKGLPVVTGCKISLLNDELPPYICEFSNDDTPIDIERIIEFYESVYSEQTEAAVIFEIRNFAAKNMDMQVVMKPIIDYIVEE